MMSPFWLTKGVDLSLWRAWKGDRLNAQAYPQDKERNGRRYTILSNDLVLLQADPFIYKGLTGKKGVTHLFHKR